MIRFLRGRRRQLLFARKLKHYLLYAIGEVFLVVIGILIALQINTWNEERKNLREFRDILLIIKQDLAQDTAEVAAAMRVYAEKKPIYHQVLSDSASERDYRSRAYVGLIMNYAPVTVDTRGYNQLRDFKGTSRSAEYDSLESDLIQFYSYVIDRIEEDQTKVTSDYLKNVEYWKEHHTFFLRLFIKEEPLDKDIDYFLRSEDYQSRVAFHYSLVYNNYLPTLSLFNELTAVLLQDIDNLLASK